MRWCTNSSELCCCIRLTVPCFVLLKIIVFGGTTLPTPPALKRRNNLSGAKAKRKRRASYAFPPRMRAEAPHPHPLCRKPDRLPAAVARKAPARPDPLPKAIPHPVCTSACERSGLHPCPFHSRARCISICRPIHSRPCIRQPAKAAEGPV